MVLVSKGSSFQWFDEHDKRAKWAMKNNQCCLGLYRGLYYPVSYIGIIIDYCKDPH